MNGKKRKTWKQGPLTWGCSTSSCFSQCKCLAYDLPLQHPFQLSPDCHLVLCAQQRQTCYNVSFSPAEIMMLPLEEKKKDKTCLMHSRAKEKCLLDYPQFQSFSMLALCWGRFWRQGGKGSKSDNRKGKQTRASKGWLGEELVPTDGNSQVMVDGKAWGSFLRVLGSGRPFSLLLPLFGKVQSWVECSPFS